MDTMCNMHNRDMRESCKGVEKCGTLGVPKEVHPGLPGLVVSCPLLTCPVWLRIRSLEAQVFPADQISLLISSLAKSTPAAPCTRRAMEWQTWLAPIGGAILVQISD